MHITFNRASNNIRNVSLASGSTSSLGGFLGRSSCAAISRCLFCLAPHSANTCQLAASLPLVNPGRG